MIKLRSALPAIIGLFCVGVSQNASAQVAHIAPPAVSTAAPNVHIAPPAAIYSKGAHVQASKYDCGDPTAEEQYVIELINRARADPAAEGVRLSTTQDGGIVNNLQHYSEPTRDQVKSEFATYPAQPPLACNPKLLAMARSHSQNMLDNGYQGHDGPDGSFPDRFNASGYPPSAGGENVFDYGTDGWDIHANFQYDFGNYPTIGHRTNIMNMTGAVYTEVGIGIIDGTNSGAGLGPKFTTEDYGAGPQNFILGVVYNDANHNGICDPGEGVSGVTITPTGGSYYAVSSTSGGYAIPYNGSGTVTVKATGGPFGTTGTTQSISFNGQNVKVDFLVNGLPGSVVLDSPAPDSAVGGASVKFTWEAQTGATRYQLMVATDTSMAKKYWVFNDSTTITGTMTSKSVPNLKDSTLYYWRMRAQNAKGWGAYGPVQAFTVYLPLPIVKLLTPANAENVGSGDVQLTWNDAGPRATNYVVQVSTSQTMKPLVLSDTLTVGVADPDTLLSIPAATLKGSTLYYWQVLVENEAAWSAPQTPARSFITGASGVADGGAVDQAVTLSPNPSNGVAHLHFTLDKPAVVSCQIFNDLGQQVHNIQLGSMSASAHDLSIDASNLAAGSYAYILRMGDRTASGRLVIVK